ncbi:MAG: hypothetical protein AAB479_01705 [Patescibacteria group bacterium]
MIPQQNKLILYLVIILGFAGGYYYYSQSGSDYVVAPLPQEGRDDIKVFEHLKIDFALLQNPAYKSLRLYGEFPVNPGVRGKNDPFSQ